MALLVLVQGTAALAASARAAPPANPAGTIDRYLAVRAQMGRFSGAVLVARGDRVLLRKGYGFADFERRTPYRPEARQPVASLTKMFTAMAVLELRDRGALDLGDSICRFLDDCPAAWRAVTIDELVHHRSGIPDYEDSLGMGSESYDAVMTRPGAALAIARAARSVPLEFEPGSRFKYSNTGYIVLSQIIERAAGKPFAAFVRESLLEPAEMTRSRMFGDGGPDSAVAVGYTQPNLTWEQRLSVAPDSARRRTPWLPLTPPAGDGGLYSTVDDLLRWSRAMDRGRVVSRATAAEALTPDSSGYGFGWIVDRAFDRVRIHHNGFLPGYTSEFAKFPEESLTIILVSNLGTAPLGRIVRDVSAIALGAPFDMPVRGHVVRLTKPQVAKLEGVYRMKDGGRRLTVHDAPDYLTAEMENGFIAGLIPLSPTVFYFPLGDGTFTFTLDAAGRAESVNLRYGGEDHIGARVAAKP